MTALFLSPHLDDVVLSASIAVQGHVARGERVVVATVFSEGHQTHERRREDVAALSLLGAEVRHLGLLDAPERRGRAGSFRGLCLDRDEARERAELDCVRKAIEALVAELCPTVGYFPLAVGGHVDHRLVCATHAAVERALFYEDMPYAAVDGWVLARVGSGASQPGAGFAPSLLATLGPLLDSEHDLPGAERAWREAPRHPALPRLEAALVVPDRESAERRIAAISRYVSQLAALFPGGGVREVYEAVHAGGERLWARQ